VRNKVALHAAKEERNTLNTIKKRERLVASVKFCVGIVFKIHYRRKDRRRDGSEGKIRMKT
jgi:hypothetical protein